MATTTSKKKSSTKKKPTAAERILRPNPSVALYRKIAFSFLGVVGLLLLVVIYLSTVQAVIRVVPVGDVVRAEFLVDVVQTPTRPSEVRGTVFSAQAQQTKTFTPDGDGKTPVQGTATGKVIIINESNRTQPLVATTRLLSSDGVLFRLKDGVTVPANGQVIASVYADEAGPRGDLAAPATFRIPGLADARQEVIYAKSDTAFEGGQRFISAISQDDLDGAHKTLLESVLQDLLSTLRESSGGLYKGEAFFEDVKAQRATHKAGDEADTFDVTVDLREVGVFFDEEALHQLALAQLYLELTPGTQLVAPDVEDAVITVERFDEKEKKANLRVVLEGTRIASATSDALDPGRFRGMSADEVREQLIGDGVARQVYVEFFPFWVKSVPRLRDHIIVEIE